MWRLLAILAVVALWAGAVFAQGNMPPRNFATAGAVPPPSHIWLWNTNGNILWNTNGTVLCNSC